MGEVIRVVFAKKASKPSGQPAKVLRLRAPAADARMLYEEASKLDEDSATYEHAKVLYKRALELAPGMLIAQVNLANIHYRQGRIRKAAALYKGVISKDPSIPEAHYNYGYILLEQDHYQEAVQLFLKTLKLAPDFNDAHFNLGYAYKLLDQYERAIEQFRAYLRGAREREDFGAQAQAHLIECEQALKNEEVD